jgi:nucleoside-diphosphate-sugar epimerase
VIAILGLGRVGRRIARALRSKGERVRASHRSGASDPDVDEVVALDLGSPGGVGVPPAHHGAGGTPAPPFRAAFESLIRGARVLVWAASRYDAELISSSKTRVLLLGSTSVYAEDAGAEVDEESATAGPLVAAERAVGANGCVLRLAGLYAKGRGPQSLLASAPTTSGGAPRLEPPGERVLNLVHEEDAARAAIFAIERDLVGVWNVSDGAPVTRAHFYSVAARSLGLPEPVFDLGGAGVSPARPPGGEPRLGRRVSNRKLLASGFVLLHTDLASGLLG